MRLSLWSTSLFRVTFHWADFLLHMEVFHLSFSHSEQELNYIESNEGGLWPKSILNVNGTAKHPHLPPCGPLRYFGPFPPLQKVQKLFETTPSAQPVDCTSSRPLMSRKQRRLCSRGHENPQRCLIHRAVTQKPREGQIILLRPDGLVSGTSAPLVFDG